MASAGGQDAEEARHFQEVVASLRHYYTYFRRTLLERLHRHHCTLTEEHVTLLPGGADGITRKIDLYEAALHANQLFFDRILMHMNQAPSPHTSEDSIPTGPPFAEPLVPFGEWQMPAHHADKLTGILHAVSRDWGAEGLQERDECYVPLLDVLRDQMPAGARVLVPGSGLGRLACEVAGLGLQAQGNDFDYFMLFAADFMLNGTSQAVPIHPWVHGLCNNLSHGDACRRVDVPDRPASKILTETWPERAPHRDFSMCAGEFLLAYAEAPAPEDHHAPPTRTWDAVVCSFFIDTAPNILDYVRLIWRSLADGGLWISLGPLQYHWADPYSALAVEDANTPAARGKLDARYHQSIELSWEELSHAIQAAGFVLEHEEQRTCHYSLNPRSMHRTQYNCTFFVARKPGATSHGEAPTAEGT